MITHFKNNIAYIIFWEMFAGALGCIIALKLFVTGTLFGDVEFFVVNTGLLIDNPKLMLWLFAAMIEVSLCFIFLVPVLFMALKPLGDNRDAQSAGQLLPKLIFGLFSLFAVLSLRIFIFGNILDESVRDNMVPHAAALIKFKEIIGMSFALLCALGIVNLAIRMNSDDNVKRQNEIRKRLDYFLIFLGIILTVSSVQHALYQSAYLETGNNPALFPHEQVLFNGLFNSFLIALVYLPARFIFELNRKNNGTREARAETEPLTLMQNIFGQLKTVVPILAPFLGSLIPN